MYIKPEIQKNVIPKKRITKWRDSDPIIIGNFLEFIFY